MKAYTWEMFQDPTWDRERVKVVEAFRTKIWSRPVDGCWIWTGAHNESDYGLFNGPWLKELAHRLSYEMDVGLLGKDGIACHRCDTPPCVNPSHLFRGSRALNTFDKHAKGRSRSDFEVRNARSIKNLNLIMYARALRWTADLLICPTKSCRVPPLSGTNHCPRGCPTCKKRHQVIGLHMSRQVNLDSVDEKDPTYLLRLLTPIELEYVKEVAGE